MLTTNKAFSHAVLFKQSKHAVGNITDNADNDSFVCNVLHVHFKVLGFFAHICPCYQEEPLQATFMLHLLSRLKQDSASQHHTAFSQSFSYFSHFRTFSFLTSLILVCCIKTKKLQYEAKCFSLKVTG